MAILKNVCGQHSMREMEENFNKETCIDTLRIMSGNSQLEEMPHYDTLNYYLERLSPECLSGLRKKMITSLIRGKQFNKWRLQGKYWKVILDGTGLFYFKERHCEINAVKHTTGSICLPRKIPDRKSWMKGLNGLNPERMQYAKLGCAKKREQDFLRIM